jgi:hypothetical protein
MFPDLDKLKKIQKLSDGCPVLFFIFDKVGGKSCFFGKYFV